MHHIGNIKSRSVDHIYIKWRYSVFCTVLSKISCLVSCLIRTNIKKWLWSIPRKSLNGAPEWGGPWGHLITIDFIPTMLWFGQLLQQHGPNGCAVSYSVVHYTWYMGILRGYPPGQLCRKSIRCSYCISVTVRRAVYGWVVPFVRTNETLAGFPSLSAFYYIVSWLAAQNAPYFSIL